MKLKKFIKLMAFLIITFMFFNIRVEAGTLKNDGTSSTNENSYFLEEIFKEKMLKVLNLKIVKQYQMVYLEVGMHQLDKIIQ